MYSLHFSNRCKILIIVYIFFLILILCYQPCLIPSDSTLIIQLVFENLLGFYKCYVLWSGFQMSYFIPFKLIKLLLHSRNPINISKSLLKIFRLNHEQVANTQVCQFGCCHDSRMYWEYFLLDQKLYALNFILALPEYHHFLPDRWKN